MLKKLIRLLPYIKWQYLLQGSIVLVQKGGKLHIEKHCTISHCTIKVASGCTLSISSGTTIKHSKLIITNNNSSINIGKSCLIDHCQINVNGTLCLGDENILEKGYSHRYFSINTNGKIFIGNRNRLRGRIWLRYNGTLSIGNYNNINEDSEIRCDESVTIGSYNQISYECMIWDTNTHCIYNSTQRRKLTENKFPSFGFEYERPKTKAISIGDDCWIGKRTSILKGTSIGNRCIIGYGTTICNENISDNKTVIEQRLIKSYDNNI